MTGTRPTIMMSQNTWGIIQGEINPVQMRACWSQTPRIPLSRLAAGTLSDRLVASPTLRVKPTFFFFG